MKKQLLAVDIRVMEECFNTSILDHDIVNLISTQAKIKARKEHTKRLKTDGQLLKRLWMGGQDEY